MSCNGCRVLRRGCTENCTLRSCLEWIQSPTAQANATIFVSKFFGRSDLMSFISSVPENKRPALFHSLLFEACGRTVNPVGGAVGLLSSGNWHICQAAVDTVLSGGELRPLSVGIPAPARVGGSEGHSRHRASAMHGPIGAFVGEYRSQAAGGWGCLDTTASVGSGLSEVSPELGGSNSDDNRVKRAGGKTPKLLNLFP